MPPVTVSVLPALVSMDVHMLSADLMTARTLNPGLAARIASMRPLPASTSGTRPREELTTPLCPAEEVSDTVLFEDAADPAKHYFLPRYRLLERDELVQARFGRGPSGGWTLTLHLESHPAPELGEGARGATPLEHSLEVILRHRLTAGGEAVTEEVFQEVSFEEGGARAALHKQRLEERDFLFQVLTDPGFAAVLIVRRTVRVALAEPVLGPITATSWSQAVPLTGDLPLDFETGIQREGGDVVFDTEAQLLIPRNGARIAQPPPESLDRAGVEQFQSFDYSAEPLSMHLMLDIVLPDSRPARPGVQIALCWDRFVVVTHSGLFADVRMDGSGRLTPEGIQHMRGGASGILPPGGIRLLGGVRADWRTLRLNPPRPAGFREVTRTLDHTLERNPFVFRLDLYGYVFSGITGIAGSVLPPTRRQVPWNGVHHSYYQDPITPSVFYYLPDAFKLARRPESPHLPFLSVRFVSSDGTEAGVRATLDYWSVPYVDAARLEAASRELASLLTDPLPRGVTGPRLEPLLADKVRLFLALPRGDGSTAPQEIPDLQGDLRTGFLDSRALTLAGFQGLFDALLDGSAVLFQGSVEVLSPQGPVERIPFIARLDDMVGSVLDADVVLDEAGGGLQVTLRNAIESPVRLSALNLSLRRGSVRTVGHIQAPGPTLPVELTPGQTLTFGVTPALPLEEPGPVQVAIEPSGVKVLPDRTAVWRAVLRADTLAEYERTIEVITSLSVFGTDINSINIEFQRGDTLIFQRDSAPEQLQVKTQVRVPISDLIERREDPGTYHWRGIVIRRDSKKSADAEWRKGTAKLLFVTTDDLPVS